MISLLTPSRFRAARIRLMAFQQTRSKTTVEIPRHRLILPRLTTSVEEPSLIPSNSDLPEACLSLPIVIVGIERNLTFTFLFLNLVPLILKRPASRTIRQTTRVPDIPKPLPAGSRQAKRATQLVRLFPCLSGPIALERSNSEEHVASKLTNRSRYINVFSGTDKLSTYLLNPGKVERDTVATTTEATELPHPDFVVRTLLHQLDATHDLSPEVPPGGVLINNPFRDEAATAQGGLFHNALLDVDTDHLIAPRGYTRISNDRN
ncbi:hypothetical protein a10_09505 [Streptomyces acidiscabies]|nr:hypothetical protein a10_09505 [Streptomyces acidiscabies]